MTSPLHHLSRPPVWRRWLALALLAACGPSTPPLDDAATAPATDTARTVTLITGDRVRVDPDAAVPVQVRPGPGRAHVAFVIQRVGGETLVIPHDVAELVASGQLDRALFNITQLLAEGHDDAQRDDLPLIMTGQADLPAMQRRLASPGLTVDRVMPALHAAAVRQRKGASSLIAQLAGAPAQQIWLDRRFHLSLDHSVPQIGAPVAWANGYTGAGVVVAVLDSGVDAEHPDLAGKVLDAESFAEDELGVGDIVGHGTHVASTIAGTGAASGGLYRGVAPDAAIVSGRVCESRFCSESAMLAGMEWAVVTKHAKIVNLSIGGVDDPTLDPLEQAVNELSAQYGALFVVAAGNGGRVGDGFISSPGSADAALTVGAVDRADQLAVFSSRGPRTGDHAIKPDLTAPGVEIVAARASTALPDFGVRVGPAYTRVSGTSMATPHVAGAAAILLQQHADWTGAQLKAALVASASPHPTLTVFAQGAGRVDVARAMHQTVVAAPSSVSLGLASWPHDDDPVLQRTVTYRNDGAAPITLAVSGGLGQAGATAAGMLAISPSSITVPAGGTADVVVTVDTRGERPDGLYAGALIATGGDVRVVTPIAVEREAASHDLTVRTLDHNGNSTGAMGFLSSLDHPGRRTTFFRTPATLRVEQGRYEVNVVPREFMGLVYPRLDVTQAMTVDLDQRLAKPVVATIPGLALEPVWFEAQYRDLAHDEQLTLYAAFPFMTGHFGPSAAPGEIHSFVIETLVPAGAVDGRVMYVLAHRERDRFLTGWSETIPASKLATVHASHLGDADRWYRKLTIAALDDVPGAIATTSAADAAYAGPFERTERYFGDGFTWAPVLEQLRDFEGELESETRTGHVLQRYRSGHTYVERWNRAPFGPAFSEVQGVRLATRSGDSLWVSPSMFSEVSTPSRLGLSEGTAHLALFRDDQLLIERTGSGLTLFPAVNVPPEPATYRLEVEAKRPPELSELSSNVSASWTFASSHVTGTASLALPTLRFTPALDDHNRARRRLPLILPVAIERPIGAPTPAIASATIDASFDDGATWSRVPGALIGARWFGVVLHPPGAQYVSLRGSARDVVGNRVEQTIVRAYKLAP